MDFIKSLFKKYRGVISYLFFGVLTTAVNIIVYYLCYNLSGIPNVVSTVVAWVVAVAFAFFTNKLFVFESKSWAPSIAVKEATSFVLCRVASGVIELIIMYIFVDLIGVDGLVMKLVTNVIVIILNYIASKLIIFKKK